ncbi:MAG: RHS repeat-associated core domain-containing protein, partial [Curvibacter sp.]|nr:RHS repeat-associated core domain-containing protein [Curvibacter sp.]
VNGAAPQVFYVHADHLNTPRAVVDQNNVPRWTWYSEPFGTTAANSNPSGLGAFVMNLRFPGQVYDAESGMHYNWHRYYIPGAGIYGQSDPLGLDGGLFSTFSYVNGDPMNSIDPSGLDVLVCFYAGGVGHVGFGDGNPGNPGTTRGFYPKNHLPIGPGKVDDDSHHPKKECVIIPATPEQDACMNKCEADREESPGTYNVMTRQCTSFVRDCLKECKLPHGTFGPGPEPWYRSLPGTQQPSKINLQ